MTQQRRIIYDVIRKSKRHMTAEQIYLEAKQILPSIAMGTVYRNLGLMTASGEVLRIEMPGQPDRFDKTVCPHHHCICTRCGEVYDIPVPDLSSQLEKLLGTPVISYDLTVHLVCDACRGENALEA